jgi:voltage-gated potassium channel Kch
MIAAAAEWSSEGERAPPPRPVLRRSQRHGIILLFATVLLLLVMPSAEPYPAGGALVALLFLLTIAAGMAAMPGHGGYRVALLALPFAIGWLAAWTLDLAVPVGSGKSLRLAPLLGLTLTLLVLANILRVLAVARQISAGVLAEAFTGYLLIAVAFAQTYDTLDQLLPGAFNTAAPPGTATAFFTYFSLVTLTSVGFGDIVPIHPFVRMIAALESVCGLFYTAIIVARLVAAYTPSQVASPTEPGPGEAGDRDDR